MFIDNHTTDYCKELVNKKLIEIFGERDGLDLLTSFIWHTIIQKDCSKQHLANEIREFMGPKSEVFVDWIVKTVGPYITGSIKLPQPSSVLNNNIQNEDNKDINEDQQQHNNVYKTTTQLDENAHADKQMVNGTTNEDLMQTENNNMSTRKDRNMTKSNKYSGNNMYRNSRYHDYDNNTKQNINHHSISKIYINTETGQPMKLVPINNTKSNKIKKKCINFPNCPLGSKCAYIHPEELCHYWPKCPYSSNCFYIHPESNCKYGINCPKPDCNFVHPPEWKPENAIGRFNPYSGTFKNLTYTPQK